MRVINIPQKVGCRPPTKKNTTDKLRRSRYFVVCPCCIHYRHEQKFEIILHKLISHLKRDYQ